MPRHYQALQFTAGKDSCIVYKWWWEVPPWILQVVSKGGLGFFTHWREGER